MRVIVVSLLYSFSLLGQQSGDYSIGGVVLNAQTGEPVKYAMVTLMSFGRMEPPHQGVPPKPPRMFQKSTQTGAMGEFQFNGLDKARYTVRAQKPGFGPAMSPDQLMKALDLTASVSGLQIKLSPLGVIEGKVVDQNDEPLRGVNIVALEAHINDGLRETNSVRSVATDDRGQYRLWNLTPGRYYIKAAGKSGGTYRYVSDGTPYYSSWQSFTPVYFGGARSLDTATPLQIEYGAKASADFRLNLEPAFRIRGTLANVPAGTVTFDLLQGSEDVSASRTSLNSSTGRFEVQDVTPGAYILRATQEGKMRGETMVTVSDSDVNGVSIALAPAVNVESVTRILGSPLKASQVPGYGRFLAALGADRDEKEEYNQTIEPSCTVSFHDHGGASNPRSATTRRLPHRASAGENGVFTIGEFLPGSYAIHIQCEGGYATSALAGGADLLANPNLLIQPGVAPPQIEIQVKPGGGTLSGDLAVRPLPKNTAVLLVPAFSNSTGPVMIQVEDDPETPEKIQFMHPFLAPGEYVAYAFSEWQQIEFRSPGFLKALSGGVSVRIEDGKEQQISITKLVK